MQKTKSTANWWSLQPGSIGLSQTEAPCIHRAVHSDAPMHARRHISTMEEQGRTARFDDPILTLQVVAG